VLISSLLAIVTRNITWNRHDSIVRVATQSLFFSFFFLLLSVSQKSKTSSPSFPKVEVAHLLPFSLTVSPKPLPTITHSPSSLSLAPLMGTTTAPLRLSLTSSLPTPQMEVHCSIPPSPTIAPSSPFLLLLASSVHASLPLSLISLASSDVLIYNTVRLISLISLLHLYYNISTSRV
jgi:hypothetical protein